MPVRAPALCLAVVCLSLLGARAAPTNLLLNSTFESGLLTPSDWQFNTVQGNRVVWLRDAGARYLVELAGVGRDWAGLTSAVVPAEVADGRVTVAGRVRLLDDGPAQGALYVRFLGETGFLGQDGPGLDAVGRDWTAVSAVVRIPDSATRLDVSVQLRSAHRLLVSDLALVPGDHGDRVAAELTAATPPVAPFRAVSARDQLPADRNANGLADALEQALDLGPDAGVMSARLTRPRNTSFQTPTGYREDNDLKVDAVIVAGNDAGALSTWKAMGYEPHCMVGFRADERYVSGSDTGADRRDECQTTASGTLLTCGPGSYYMVPTENRRRIFHEFFAEAVRNGAVAVCPEEPEFFAAAGYSDSFRREWQAFYGEPWEDPAGSVAASRRSERLKQHLEQELMQACYAGARSIDPNIECFLLAHSPLNYTDWRVAFAHEDLIRSAGVDAMVAQVWTGTAQTPVRYAGRRASRTFENAYLEYASCVGLTRGLDVDLWFLMDPLEDDPNRTMAAYLDNYLRTLAASLLFPDVTRFETMPWPTRIFGRVPGEFATVISSVVNVLAAVNGPMPVEWDGGPAGVGVFLADSAMLQRAAPYSSDTDDFYGLTLPLVLGGLPVAVPYLDRVTDPGYLDDYRVLYLACDLLKPESEAVNQALAAWVRDGGRLVVFGGEDPHNSAPEWWQGAGYERAQDQLLELCGIDVSNAETLAWSTTPANLAWTLAATVDTPVAHEFDPELQAPVRIVGVAPGEAGILVRCGDRLKHDGYGALITRVRAEGIREGQPWRVEARPGDVAEQEILFRDDGSQLVNGDRYRFCDGRATVVYAFPFDPGTEYDLILDLGNQYEIHVAPAPAELAGRRRLQAVTDGRHCLGTATLEPGCPSALTHYPGAEVEVLYASETGVPALVRREVGKGEVWFGGFRPAVFAASPEGARAAVSLTRTLIEAATAEPWTPQGYVTLKRGPWLIARAFDQPVSRNGRFVDVLDAGLRVLDGITLEPDGLAVVRDVTDVMQGHDVPRALWCSSCVEWQDEAAERTRLVVSGAKGVRGSLRLWIGDRENPRVTATDAAGAEVRVEVLGEDGTLLVRYPDQPTGLALDLRW